MSEKDLDNLFKQKLGVLKQKPSDMAWATLEDKLVSKKKKGLWIWWNLAAGVLLLAITISVFRYLNTENIETSSSRQRQALNMDSTVNIKSESVHNQKVQKKGGGSTKIISHEDITNQKAEEPELAIHKETKRTHNRKKENKIKGIVSKKPQKLNTTEKVTHLKKDNANIGTGQTHDSMKKTDNNASVNSKTNKLKKGVKLEYTLPNVQAASPVMEHKETVAGANTAEEEQGLKKIFQKAKKKTKDIRIASIRKAKDDFLTININKN